MKKIMSWIKNLKGWQKVLSLIVILGIVAIVIWLLLLLAFKISSSIEKGKLENYLIKVGYSCKGNSCTRTEKNKKEEVSIASDFYDPKVSVTYSVEVEDTYKVFIYSHLYKKNGSSMDEGFISAYDLKINEEILYIPEDYYKDIFEGKNNDGVPSKLMKEYIESEVYWHEGDTAVSVDKSATDLSSYVNDALREFESYFNGAEVKIN